MLLPQNRTEFHKKIKAREGNEEAAATAGSTINSFNIAETDEILHLRKRLHELELEGDELIPWEKQLEESLELLHHEIYQKRLALAQWERRSTLQTATKEANDRDSEFRLKYVKVASGAEPSVVKAEDEDCIFLSPGMDGSGEYLMQELEVLDQQLKKQLVEKELCDVKCQKVFDEICGTQGSLREFERRSALPYAVIPFVAEIEKANRYFEFKKAVKEKYRLEFSTKPYLMPFDIADILRADDELNSKFNKFGDLNFGQASLAIYYELGDEIRLKRKVTYTGDLQNRGFKKREDMALDQPIYNLVFQGRAQCGVMDEDPIVELEKIMKSNSSLYDACFDMSRKPVDGLETAVAAARLKYSEIWSKYFKAPKGEKDRG